MKDLEYHRIVILIWSFEEVKTMHSSTCMFMSMAVPWQINTCANVVRYKTVQNSEKYFETLKPNSETKTRKYDTVFLMKSDFRNVANAKLMMCCCFLCCHEVIIFCHFSEYFLHRRILFRIRIKDLFTLNAKFLCRSKFNTVSMVTGMLIEKMSLDAIALFNTPSQWISQGGT